MGVRIEANEMRGALANDLFVAVRSSLAPVAALLVAERFELSRGPVAAEVYVNADPAARQKRFLLHEYYTRVEWRGVTSADVQINGATGLIEWSGKADETLRAELRIYPEGAPESLGIFLRLLASLLLPSRRGVLIHASGVVVHGEGLVFLGESGAGKTTTARRVGREGALRIADDLAILRVDSEQRISVEPCRFDRGGRLPGRSGTSWPLRAAYDVQKAAPVTQDAGPGRNPLAAWCAALLSPSGPPGALDSLLSVAGILSRSVPPRSLHVSPAGPVLHALLPPSPPVEPSHAAPLIYE